jgi:hypothetical protein
VSPPDEGSIQVVLDERGTTDQRVTVSAIVPKTGAFSVGGFRDCSTPKAV